MKRLCMNWKALQRDFLKFNLGHSKALLIILQKHGPIKKRYVRANQASFINCKTHKEVMRRTRLTNKFIDSKTDADRMAYDKQRNYCVSLIRKEKTPYYSNLNIRDVMGNKIFWTKLKPFFSEKVDL